MDLLVTMVPLALVVGLSPLPILPILLLLSTTRANVVAYLIAWVVTLTAVVLVTVFLGSAAAEASDEPAPSINWVQVVTGAVFLVLAGVKFLGSRGKDSHEPPGWMAALESATPSSTARLGALLAGLNPKNLAMAIAAGAEIAVYARGAADKVGAIAVFVVIGSLGVGVPVVARVILGDRAAGPLATGRDWLMRNASTVSIVVLLVLGVLLLVKGLSGA
ncbi:MAG: GAP family protein [Candidatus Nanopelagicales bacterium]